jgi:outer membrane lipoprotein-sorting protein
MGIQRAAGFVTSTVFALAALSAASAATRPDLFDDLYRRGQKLNENLHTLTASFVETTSSPLLTRPLVARGTIAVERPARIALRYADPEPRLVLVEGDRMTTVWPSRHFRDVKDIGAAQRRIQKYFVGSGPDELRKHFTISTNEARDGGAYAIVMTPTRKQIREGLALLELWVDRQAMMLTEMRMTFAGGETKSMTFTGVVTNAPIDPAMFREIGTY